MRCALLVFLLPATLLAGEMKVKDTGFLHDYAVTRGFMRGRPIKAKPTPDDKAVLFLRSDAKSPKLSLFEFTIADRATRTLLTPEEVLKGAEEKLSPEEKAIRERMRISAAGFADFQLAPAGDGILLSLAGRLYIVSRKDKAVRELKTGRGPLLDPKFSPDMRYVSYVRDNDVHLYDLATDKELRLTTGGTEEVSNGLAEFVAQEEMDRFAGYWWAPDGKSVVLQQSDARKVEKWQVGDPFHPERPATPFFYPRPGKANVDVRLFSASVPDGKTTAIAWDRAKYPYLATVRWSKKSPLLVCVQTRDQRELVVLRIDPAGGVDVWKWGISGAGEDAAGLSLRAERQVRALNRAANGAYRYESSIVRRLPGGAGVRQAALALERQLVYAYKKLVGRKPFGNIRP